VWTTAGGSKQCDVLVHLSNVYSQLAGTETEQKNEDAAQVGFNRMFSVCQGCSVQQKQGLLVCSVWLSSAGGYKAMR
jgi:hypothetical protein